jgi:ABC-type glycerol-3-phosphate transport system substrate-binding protein
MKRVLILLLMAVAIGTWAAPTTLTWMLTGVYKFTADEDQFRGYASATDKLAGDFEKAHPGTKVQILYRDIKQGSMTVDALMAAGTPPDAWLDAAGYFDKYMNADYALPMEKYIDVGIYRKDLIDIYTRNGHVYALPESAVAGGFAINLDMLDSIGYKMPDLAGWTTDEFLALGAKLKEKGIPLTMIMAKGGIGTWNNVFLFAFGAEFFKNRDYTKCTINSKEALAGLNYIKKLIDLGYAYPNPIEVNDDAGVELFTTGQVFSCMMQNGHTDYWIPEQVKQGKIAKAMKITFVEVPHATGRVHTPVYGYETVSMAHYTKGNEVKNKLVAALNAVSAGKEIQFYNCAVNGGFPTILNFRPAVGAAGTDSYKAIGALANTAGLMTEFPRGDKGAELNRVWATMTESFIRGKVDAQTMLNQFDSEAKRILK